MEGWFPIVLLTLVGAAGFRGGNMVMSQFLLGPNKPSPEKSAPYECGMPPVGDARERQSVKFYLVAMIFLLFDIEVAFLYPWAMALRDLRRGRAIVQIVTFFAAAGWPATSTSGERARSTGAPRARSDAQSR